MSRSGKGIKIQVINQYEEKTAKKDDKRRPESTSVIIYQQMRSILGTKRIYQEDLNSIQQMGVIQQFFDQKQMVKPSLLQILLLLVVLVQLASPKGTIITTKPTSTPCGQCGQNFIADNVYNGEKLQSYIINGVKYSRPLSYYLDVFAKNMPFYFTTSFIRNLEYFDWEVKNNKITCSSSSTRFYDRDVGMSTSVQKVSWYVLKQLNGDKTYSRQWVGRQTSISEQTFFSKIADYFNSTVKVSRTKKTIELIGLKVFMSGFGVMRSKRFYNCYRLLRQALRDRHYDPLYTWLQGYPYTGGNLELEPDYIWVEDYLDQYLQEWGYIDFQGIPTHPYYNMFDQGKTAEESFRLCPVIMDPDNAFDSQSKPTRMLQTAIDPSEYDVLHLILENKAPDEASIFSPSRISQFAGWQLSPDMFTQAGISLTWNPADFQPGESEFTIWADYAAAMLAPVLYCSVPGILSALKTSCPSTCTK